MTMLCCYCKRFCKATLGSLEEPYIKMSYCGDDIPSFFLNAGCGAGGFVNLYIVLGAGAGGLRSVRAVGRAGYEKKMTRAPLMHTE